MSSYILVHRKDVDKCWWNDLVKACAVIGDNFEIHCWSDETAEIMAALAFQNMDVKLTQCGHDSWKWSQRGDNHGKTMKIMDKWYYFEASF